MRNLVEGATVNDVALAVIGGALRTYGMGLINIVGSYDEQFVLSFTGCREMMPDPAHYADCIERSFGDLVAVDLSRYAIAASKSSHAEATSTWVGSPMQATECNPVERRFRDRGRLI